MKKAIGSSASARRRAARRRSRRDDRGERAAHAVADRVERDRRRPRLGDRQRQVAGEDDAAAAARRARRAGRSGSRRRRHRGRRTARRAARSSAVPGRASRASATRRRWPCDRVRTGAARRLAMPTRARAASSSAAVGRAAVELAQEAQRLGGAQLLLQGIGMGEIERPADRLRLAPGQPAGFRARQAGQGAQQRRLALAVGAADPDDRARLEARVEAAEQRPLAAAALQPFDGEERGGSVGGAGGHGSARL